MTWRSWVTAGWLGLGAAWGCAQGAVRTPESVVQINLETYNRHDLEAFAATYAQEIQILDLESGVPRIRGMAELKTHYGARFRDNPKLKAEVANRILQGQLVIDQERLTGLLEKPGGRELEPTLVTVISEIREGRITRVWIAR
jgi:hypothetical protein